VISEATGTAHGKLILLGEHAVVYGAPAIAAGIHLGARASATPLPAGAPSTLDLGGRAITADTDTDDDVPRAFGALLRAGGAPPLAISASSELPPGGGLGSSAALGVAMGRAVEALLRRGAANDEERERAALARARAWESVFHGTPSGIDTAAAALGGCFRFTRADGVQQLAPAADLWICVGWSGAGVSTRTMVEGVARLAARKPDVVASSMRGVTSLVDNAALAIEAGDLTGLGRLMNLNQMILAGLMLSTERLEQLCSIARAAGALGAKLTGAGGGGSVIALCRSSRVGHTDVADDDAQRGADAILGAWKDAGYDGFLTRVPAVAHVLVVERGPESAS